MTPDDELERKEECLNYRNEDLWEILKKEKNWKNRMFPVDYAYHVTNVPETDHKPAFQELKWHLANDFTYDRQLVGLPCVFFVTTQHSEKVYKLLSESPYPARPLPGNEQKKHWRVRVPLDKFKGFDVWYCKHPAKNSNSMYQVRLILTKDSGERKYVENIPDIMELPQGKENPFLYNNNGTWYSNNYYNCNLADIDRRVNYIVNIVVLKDVSLEGIDTWDCVQRSEVGPGKPLSRDQLAAAVIRKWSAYRKRQNLNEQINDRMSKLDVGEGSNPKESK